MLDDLLAGIEGAQHFLADRLLGDALDEVVGDVEVDVGFEQGLADLLQAFADVGFGEPAAAAQLLEGLAQTALNAFKHSLTSLLRRRRRAAGRSCADAPRKRVSDLL